MWLCRLRRTRTRLYLLFLTVSMVELGVLIAGALLCKPVELITEIPSDIIGFFIPGLPVNLVDIAMKFPTYVLIPAAFIAIVLWISRCIQLDESEYAFQRWRRVWLLDLELLPRQHHHRLSPPDSSLTSAYCFNWYPC